MAADNAAAWPRDAEIPLTDVRSVPKTGLARPPPTQQTARKGRLNFLYAHHAVALGSIHRHRRTVLVEHAGARGGGAVPRPMAVSQAPCPTAHEIPDQVH